MLRVIRWALPALAVLGVSIAFTASRAKADGDAKTASVVITIVDADGNNAANAIVKIYNKGEEPKHTKGGGGDQATSQPAPVSEVTTKDDGKVTVNLALGDYVVMAQLKSHGRGKEPLTVAAGDNAVTVTLKAGHNRQAPTTAPSGN